MSPTIGAYSNWKVQLPHSELHPYCHLSPHFPQAVYSQWQSMGRTLSRPAPRRHGTPLTSYFDLNTSLQPCRTFFKLYCRLRCFHPTFLPFRSPSAGDGDLYYRLTTLQPPPPPSFSLILSCCLLLRVCPGVIKKKKQDLGLDFPHHHHHPCW